MLLKAHSFRKQLLNLNIRKNISTVHEKYRKVSRLILVGCVIQINKTVSLATSFSLEFQKIGVLIAKTLKQL